MAFDGPDGTGRGIDGDIEEMMVIIMVEFDADLTRSLVHRMVSCVQQDVGRMDLKEIEYRPLNYWRQLPRVNEDHHEIHRCYILEKVYKYGVTGICL